MSQLTIGRKIKSHMVFLGITQVELHLRTGINRGSLSLFLNDRYVLKDEHLRKICISLSLDFTAAKKGQFVIKAKKPKKKPATHNKKEEQQAFAF